ncbi:unnamed protein product [Calypogeia fissa]
MPVRSPLFICSEAYELLVDIAIIAKRELQDIYEDQLLLSAAWDFLIESANSFALVASRGGINWDFGWLKDEHYDMMVSYLEVPENFAASTGGWKKTKVEAKYQKRVVVMNQFHAAILDFGFPKDISIPNLTKRYQRYVALYKEAQLWRAQTGGGLTEEEIANGVTIDEKLNKPCPHFHQMDEIFGARPNVAPELRKTAFLGAHTGKSRLVSIATTTRVSSPQNSTPLTPQAPQEKGGKLAKNGDKQGLPRPTLPKPGLEKKREALAPSKPSFANIYADKINLKFDYQKELIQSRDKWKAEDLAEWREALPPRFCSQILSYMH